VRAGLYLFQYTLDIKYRADKNNTVPNALSRLARLKYDSNSLSENKGILEDAINEYHCYNAIVIEISDEFKNNIKKGYDNENKYLIYYENLSNFRQHLCIPKNLEKKISRMAYDEYDYTDFYRAYDRIRASLYLHKLVKRFRTYIEHYFKYRIHQIFRHKFYRILKLIISPSISFYIICGDFVLELPVTVDDIDTALTLTDKFIKRIKIIPERAT
jgi:hypothetical protein